MAVLNWGDLTKSQVDPETIEEAIARLIAEHNANEESHLAVGQSLQSHKASEIIDHLARSVYRDKLIFDRFQIDESFATIDIWVKSARVYLEHISAMYLLTTNVDEDVQYALIVPGDSMPNAGVAANSPVWETRVKIQVTTNQEIYFGQGDPGIPSGFGFKIVDNALYGYYVDADFIEHLTLITGITLTNWNNYRCEYVSGVSLKWFVNGVLKITQTSDLPTDFNIFMLYQIKTNENNYKGFWVQSLHYDEDYSS